MRAAWGSQYAPRPRQMSGWHGLCSGHVQPKPLLDLPVLGSGPQGGSHRPGGRFFWRLMLKWLFVKSCGWILTQNEGDASERWQHAGEDFGRKVLFIEQPVCSLLDDADFAVEPLDEAQRDFVLRFAVGGDAIPMTVNHVGELFVGLQSLPLERCAPVFE